MFCFRCGKQVADDADYCPYCGARLEEGIPEGKREEKKRRRMLYEEPESIRAFSQNNGEILIRDEQKKHSIRKKWIVWALLGALLCIMAIAAVIGFSFSWQKKAGPFRSVSWGMTRAEVGKAETTLLTEKKYKDGEFILYTTVEDLKGVEKTPVEIEYSFTANDKLYGISIDLEEAKQAWKESNETDPYLQELDYFRVVQIELVETYGKPLGIDWNGGSASVFLTDDTIVVLMIDGQHLLLYDKEYFKKAWPETYSALLASPGSETIKIQEAPVKQHVEACAAVDTGHTPLMSVDGFTSELEENNFEIKEFNLLTDEIPEGTQVIILPSPSADLTEAEVKKVSDYLNDDETSEPRNLVVLYTPQMEELPNLKGLMNEWGLDVVPQSEVTATSDGSYVQYKDYMIANATDEVDLGGQSSYEYLLAPVASPVEVLWDGRNEVTTSVLMTSPEDAERLVYDAESKEMETVSSGRENLIAMGTKKYKYAGNSYRNSNVVAMGCGLLVDSNFLSSSIFSNKDYAIDLFTYLVGIGE